MLDIIKDRKLSLFSLVMINVMAVDSIRTLPISAQYGYSLLFYYLLAAIIFFIPTALAAAELASAWPQTGGVYIWIREAFGERLAFISIWLQWFYNVCWYPTIMALVSSTLAFLFQPGLAENPVYMVSTMVALYALLTFVNCLGLHFSSRFTNLAAILGTLMPMVLIMVLGAVWAYQGRPIAIEMAWKSFWPDMSSVKNLVLFTAVLYGLVGIEMTAVHAGEVNEPHKNYPRALLISAVIILITLSFGSLAIALVVPKSELSLITGLLQAFNLFFSAFHLEWMKPVISICIILGALGSVIAWIIGPAKGLMVACDDGCLPLWLGEKNTHGVPYRLLIMQLIIFVILTSVFVLLPSINSAFWLLTDITAQLALIGYVFIFASLIKLRYEAADVREVFRIPGGLKGVWCVGLIGIISSLFAVLLGFIPPTEVTVTNLWLYESMVCLGLFCGLGIPFIIYQWNQSR